MPWLPRHQNFAGKLHIRFYIIWDCVVTQMKSVVKKCFHLQFCFANRNFLSWSHLVQNVKLYSQSPFLRCSSTLDDKRSCNRLEVNGPKTPAHQANQGLQKCFLLVTFGQKYDPKCDRNGSLMNQWMWVINYEATKVKANDKNSPLIKFVGRHGVSYLGHKRPKMLKNSEFRACRVDTNLGQCEEVACLHMSLHQNIPPSSVCFYTSPLRTL